MKKDSIRYKVTFPEARNHYLEVTADYPVRGLEEVELMMAVWTPGSYLVREFSRHVEGCRAAGRNGQPLEVRKTTKNRWRVVTGSEPSIRVFYRVYCHEMSVRTNWVEEEFAILNGAPTFLTLAGSLDLPHQVELELPGRWSTSLTGLPGHPGGDAHSYRAPDFDTLVDSPILIGNPCVHAFEVGGKPHYLGMLGSEPFWDVEKCAEDIRKIVEQNIGFWGELPYEQYVFLNLVVEAAGGLEHRNSTLMMTSRWCYRDRACYRKWLGLVSHEYFHTWNVKRLRPVELGPFDYEKEVYTRSLWVGEGLTSYYDDLLLVRAGLCTREDYLKAMGRNIKTLQTTPGRGVRSLEENSFDAWVKCYRRDENSANSSMSYYTKGAIVGFLLDARIRRISGGRKSLDDVMRLAYRRYSGERGYTSAEFEATASEVADEDLSEWLSGCLQSTGELEYEEALDYYGLRFKEPVSESEDQEATTAWLGAETEIQQARLMVRQVKRGTPAFTSGVCAGDEILALDGYRVKPSDSRKRLQQYDPGDEVKVLVARRQKLLTLRVSLGRRPPDSWQLEVDEQADEALREHLEAWLHT